MVAKATTSDNTLEVVAKRKAKAAAAELAKTNALKTKLLQQQNALRSGVGNTTTSSNDKEVDAGIPEWWKELKDPKTGAVYYWYFMKYSSIYIHIPENFMTHIFIPPKICILKNK